MEIINTSCLSDLGFSYPVFIAGWSIDAFLARFLVQHLLEHRPTCIVELGSGSSTLIIARCVRAIKNYNPKHIVFDHDERYLNLTRELATANGFIDGIDYYHCPLGREPQTGHLWYDGIPDKMDGQRAELIIVDGPPGTIQPMSRYPALPVLARFSASRCTVVLDDAVRPDEREIARRWAAEYPSFTLETYSEGHGYAVLTRSEQSAAI